MLDSATEIVIERNGPAETLVVRSTPFDTRLQDNNNEVLIDVHFSGINFADTMMRLGLYPDAPSKPFVPGYEVSGTVTAVGRAVTQFKPGDRVMAGSYFGGYASAVRLPSWQVLPLPPGLSLEEGAALPVNFVTAYVALVSMGRIVKGDRVMIDCASGGVGTLAVQLCKNLSTTVVGLTSSSQKKAFIEALGATAYTHDEFTSDPALAEFDLILNSQGGASIQHHLSRLAPAGRIVCIGMSSGLTDGKRSIPRLLKAVLQMRTISLLKLFDENKGVFGLNVLRLFEKPAWLGPRLAAITQYPVKPHVDRIFPFPEAANAHRYLETRQAKGKVLLGWKT